MRQMGTPVLNRSAAIKRAHLMREIVETLLFVGLIFFIVHFALQPYRVTDVNMLPQLKPDELVVVNKAAYLLAAPGRGDVVVLVDPVNLNQQLVERVIAVPGDTVDVNASSVSINGVILKEPYISVPDGSAENPRLVHNLKLQTDQYFVMNDSRLVSNDSRSFGPLARGNIVGKAVLVFWPMSHVRGVSNYSDVFAHVGR